jgi:hypothetical protein
MLLPIQFLSRISGQSFYGFVSRIRFDDSDSNLIASAELCAIPVNMFVGVTD